MKSNFRNKILYIVQKVLRKIQKILMIKTVKMIFNRSMYEIRYKIYKSMKNNSKLKNIFT